jgi:hypothetical protein
MNTVSHQRTLNTILGLSMLLLGLLFYAGATFVFMHPPLPLGDPKLVEGDIKSCTQTLVALGHEVKRQGDDLRVSRVSPTFDNAERMLADSSLGISACSLPVVSFCMGPGCPVQGIAFTLSTKVALVVNRPGVRR